jgi:hypothetical protein
MNRYILTDEVRSEYKPQVEAFLKMISDIPLGGDIYEKDFSDTKLNPCTLGEILEEIGYEESDRGDDGWQMDFWIAYEKAGSPSVKIAGCGMTFEIILRGWGDQQ